MEGPFARRARAPGCPGSGRTHAVRADGLGAPACRTLRRGQTEPSRPSRTRPTTRPMPGQTTSLTTKGTITAAGGPLPSGNLNEESTREQPATRLTPGRPTGATSPKRPRHRPARGGAGTSPTPAKRLGATLARVTGRNHKDSEIEPRVSESSQLKRHRKLGNHDFRPFVANFVLLSPILSVPTHSSTPRDSFASLTYSFRHYSIRRGVRSPRTDLRSKLSPRLRRRDAALRPSGPPALPTSPPANLNHPRHNPPN